MDKFGKFNQERKSPKKIKFSEYLRTALGIPSQSAINKPK